MFFKGDGFGDLFDEGDDGENLQDFHHLMDHMDHQVREHNMPVTLVIESILNILKPGATEMSHDVLRDFRAAMAVQEQLPVANTVTAVWFTEFPWGIGFHFAFERGINPNEMPIESKRAIVKSLAAILNACSGIGAIATVTDDDHLRIDIEGKLKDIDVIVTNFRQELDDELGPDAPIEGLPRDGLELRDYLKRWMPDE